jgi:hypothetical protein
LRCSKSPANPSKLFWMTILGVAGAFWSAATRPRRCLKSNAVSGSLRYSGSNSLVLGGLLRSTASSFAT